MVFHTGTTKNFPLYLYSGFYLGGEHSTTVKSRSRQKIQLRCASEPNSIQPDGQEFVGRVPRSSAMSSSGDSPVRLFPGASGTQPSTTLPLCLLTTQTQIPSLQRTSFYAPHTAHSFRAPELERASTSTNTRLSYFVALQVVTQRRSHEPRQWCVRNTNMNYSAL